MRCFFPNHGPNQALTTAIRGQASPIHGSGSTVMLPAMSKRTDRRAELDIGAGSALEQAKLAVERAELRAGQAELRAVAAESELRLEREADLRLRKYNQSQLLLRGLDTFRWVTVVIASWVPLQAVEPIAHDFAGKNTRLDGSLEISIWFSIMVTISWAVTATQSRLRKGKIKTQRARLTELERELERLRQPKKQQVRTVEDQK